MPGAPPATSTEPALYLLSSARLRGTSARMSAVARRCAVSAGSSPMSATTTSPAWKRPGATASPSLRPWNVTVSAASTAAAAISPVDASTPDGTSTATTGTPAALIRAIVAAASSRGSPRKPVPKSASTITSACSTAVVSTASRPSSRRIRAAIRPSPPFEPPPQTTAMRCASGNRRSTSRATAAPARSISSATSWPSSAARASSAV